MKNFYILRHQMMHYPTVKDNVDLEFLSTPHCKIRNSSYEFAVLSKNKILRDFSKTSLIPLYINIKKRTWGNKAPKSSFLFQFNLFPETATQTILYMPFSTDYQNYSNCPRITNSCCHFVVAKILFPCYAAFVALAPVPHSVKYRFEALA